MHDRTTSSTLAWSHRDFKSAYGFEMENEFGRNAVSLAPGTEVPEVSVIVPHYSDLANLEICLAALELQTYPKAQIEIIVADNASPEGEAAVAKVIAGRARLVVVHERGAGPARNGAVALARGRFLAFTDSDCRPEPDWIVEGLRGLSRHDFVGGRMVVTVDDTARMTPVEAFERVFAFHNETFVKRKKFTVTANLFCERALFDKVGEFSANGISEDIEWCLRARDKGYVIGYLTGAVVRHPARRTWEELLRKQRRVNIELYGLARRSPYRLFVWMLKTLSLPLSAVLHTPQALFCERLLSLQQHFDAIRILYRLRWWRFVDSLRLLFSKTPKHGEAN